MTVEQLAWTLMALLAASTFGNMYYLGSKIDHLSSRIDDLVDRVSRLEGEMAAIRAAFEIHVNDRHAHGL